MPSRVIVVEPTSRYDLRATGTFGEIVYLSSKTLNPFEPPLVIAAVQKTLKDLDFNPEEDFICLTGAALTVSLMLAVVAKEFTTVRLLMFDARCSGYREREFTVQPNSVH